MDRFDPFSDRALRLLRCPHHAGVRLRPQPVDEERFASGLLHCRRCGKPWPVIAGVPVLVPDPVAWGASFRESVLATLAEFGRATPAAVAIVNELARSDPHAEPMRFGDDWTQAEATAMPAPWTPPPGAEATAPLQGWIDGVEAAGGLLPFVRRAVDAYGDPGTALVCGVGAGPELDALGPAQRLTIALDVSLRAVLVAQARRPPGTVAPVVGDVTFPPLASRSIALALALNTLDLLDAPVAAARALARVLKRGHIAVLSTPDPQRVAPDGLEGALRAAGLHVVESHPAVAWPRPHGPRHLELYFVEVVVARAT